MNMTDTSIALTVRYAGASGLDKGNLRSDKKMMSVLRTIEALESLGVVDWKLMDDGTFDDFVRNLNNLFEAGWQHRGYNIGTVSFITGMTHTSLRRMHEKYGLGRLNGRGLEFTASEVDAMREMKREANG